MKKKYTIRMTRNNQHDEPTLSSSAHCVSNPGIALEVCREGSSRRTRRAMHTLCTFVKSESRSKHKYSRYSIHSLGKWETTALAIRGRWEPTGHNTHWQLPSYQTLLPPVVQPCKHTLSETCKSDQNNCRHNLCSTNNS